MTPQQLRRKIRDLDPLPALTVSFERELAEHTTSLRQAWYSNQKEHWLGWLKEYDGPGHYGRQSWDVTAERVYNRVVNPAMVLWLGEAASVPTAQVQAAIIAAQAAGPIFAAQCGAIRRVIPWSDIEPLIAAR